jgi:hypothetical protein
MVCCRSPKGVVELFHSLSNLRSRRNWGTWALLGFKEQVRMHDTAQVAEMLRYIGLTPLELRI